MNRSARITTGPETGDTEPAGPDAGCGGRTGKDIADTVGYIADMTRELARMARADKLELLVYFLLMAHTEAASIAADAASRCRGAGRTLARP